MQRKKPAVMLLTFWIQAAATVHAALKRPNMIMIMADDLDHFEVG
jgi:hypothetical protein